MSAKINKNGKKYPIGVIPQNVIDDVTELKSAVGGLNFECTDVTFTFANSTASNAVSLSSITDIPFNKIKYINFISFGMIGVFNGIGNGTQYYCSNFAGTPITGDYLAKCVIIYES